MVGGRDPQVGALHVLGEVHGVLRELADVAEGFGLKAPYTGDDVRRRPL